MDMYRQNILDHYKHPRNFGELPNAPYRSHVANPLCGDELDFCLRFDQQEKVAEVKFTGRGCSISIASASLLSEQLKGMSRAEIGQLNQANIVELLGVDINPARMKCATLSLDAVYASLENDHGSK